MSDKIHGLTEGLTEFVGQELPRMGLDWRLTCVPFGDLTVEGDRIDDQLPFVATTAEAHTLLWQVPRFWGGSNFGESSLEAMLKAMKKSFRDRAVRILILLTDEPAHHADRSHQVDKQLDAGGFICFAASIDTPYFRRWATEHGGHWEEISTEISTNALTELLKAQIPKVARVVREVHELTGGSVQKYLALPSASRRALVPPKDT